jgi:guanylate kinase
VTDCGRKDCACSHDTPCEFGWINFTYIDRSEVTLREGGTRVIETEYEGARPCPACFPEKAEIFAASKSNRELQDNLKAGSVFEKVKLYEQQEAAKTRTL